MSEPSNGLDGQIPCGWCLASIPDPGTSPPSGKAYVCDTCIKADRVREDARLAEARAIWAQGLGDDGEDEDHGPGEREKLATMPYADYLQSPHWKVTRKAALDRACRRCERCGTQCEALDVHHRTYENRGTEQPDQLEVLCRLCHGIAHGLMRPPNR